MIWVLISCSDSLLFGSIVPIELERQTLPTPIEAQDIDPSDGVVHIELVADEHTHEIVDWRTQQTIEVQGYAYNQMLPGPVIYATVGDEIIVDLQNNMEVPTTIHWHGLKVPEDMDGVPWQRSPVMPSESYQYRFTVEQAGTFWYHPHFDTEHQVNHGLYGALIVRDPLDPVIPEIPLILDDWSFMPTDDQHEGDVFAHHAREGVWTVNGYVDPLINLDSTTRLRLINASNTGYLDLQSEQSLWIAGDQGLLAESKSTEDLLLVPGDRADLLTTGGGLTAFSYSHLGGARILESHSVLSMNTIDENLNDLTFPTEAEPPTPDPNRTDGWISFQGDPVSNEWFINGEVFPNITIQTFPLGSTFVLEVRNISATEHPFHLHGLVFEVLSVNGVQPQFKQIEDTMNIKPFERVRLLIEADNPGDWMTHCHILPHGDQGMMTVIRVE